MVQRRGLLLPVTPLTPPRQGEVVLRQAVRFRTVGDITCGSVDDGKSTLIGRLLVDSRAVLQDQLAGVQRHGQTDLALFTDGLMAEREQGITIDVAHRYFSTARRKFIIGDTPGHEQYTRNMVTAASGADAAVVLVDATKLDWADAALSLLAQTRRHALLAHLLRVPALLFAINKLDAVADPALAFRHIRAAIERFTQAAGIDAVAMVPLSALHGWNVVSQAPKANWCGYGGPTLLQILEQPSDRPVETTQALAFPVQWVEKFLHLPATVESRRVDSKCVTRSDWARLRSPQPPNPPQPALIAQRSLAELARELARRSSNEARIGSGATLA